MKPAPNRRARFNPGAWIEAAAPPAMIQKKEFVCNTCEAGLFSSPTTGTRDQASHMAANIRARQWTGRARARLEERENGGRCGHEPGRMEPEGPRLENMPMNRREAAALANCGQVKAGSSCKEYKLKKLAAYIPNWNIELYKFIDNSIKTMYI